MKKIILFLTVIAVGLFIFRLTPAIEPGKDVTGRERLLMDFNWRFAYGHPYNTEKDFHYATGYFSYFTKAGYGYLHHSQLIGPVCIVASRN